MVMAQAGIITDPIVHDALASMGVAGAIIAVLLTVITGLTMAVVYQYRHANKVYGYRLQERDTLLKALSESKTALGEVAAGMRERNAITEDLSDIIKAHTSAFAMLKEKLDLQYDVMKSDTSRIEMVIGSMTESIRTLTASVADIKSSILLSTAEVKGALAGITSASISYRQPPRSRGE